jgi:lipoprotein NlpD
LSWVPAVAALLSACATSTQRAPVEVRTPTPVRGPAVVTATTATGPSGSPTGAVATAPNGTPVPGAGGTAGVAGPSPAASAPDAATVKPGADLAGQPGTYTVKPGDTLLRIGLETGQNWRDLARWNNIENPNVLEVGQVLRVVPPASEAGVATARPVAPAPRIESRPLDARPAPSASAPSAPSGTAPPPASAPAAAPAAPTPPAPAAAPSPPAAPRDGDGDVSWGWPAAGPVTTPFDEVRSKGLGIAGKAGDPVLAAADGRVVYAGSGLRGYGNLVIVKHNATYLTAYAHNQTLLVKEDQVVRRGQKIAEMGSSDSDRVQLHFEVRRLGKPVDPAKVLPQR